MKRLKFEVIVTDNGVTITDRDRLFYNVSTIDGERKENLQCRLDKDSFAYEMLNNECNDIAVSFMEAVDILKNNK